MTLCPQRPKVKPFYSRFDLVYHTFRHNAASAVLGRVLSICSGPGSGDDLDLFLTSGFGRSVEVGVEEV
ncbi:hypothetical protein ASPWEDRAFT_44059 [Aspergillus wentii DTO 134E9]|uniref:Uncharacterized protein n=1 Tax=Aspergillus wentii DTO 134E9 TaxID=1073089 RepID=A0A1L9RAX2_ASPWE|nr:uncharacterized protein ASPWEDRAFT_44059 [Aspergillus wentii DTO 134E9]OJJ32038.1 hypothetical protein ASPWEDRAFT_44059 [Aspergillus wentii DTO 134E9]